MIRQPMPFQPEEQNAVPQINSAAVLAAYGFSAKKDILAQLLDLNLYVAGPNRPPRTRHRLRHPPRLPRPQIFRHRRLRPPANLIHFPIRPIIAPRHILQS